MVGPKIIPSKSETITRGNNNFVSLLKKAVNLARVLLRFIFTKIRKGLKDPF